MNFFAIVKLILQIGTPPAIGDETAFRQWCRQLVSLAGAFALATKTEADDKVVVVLQKITDNDTYWAAVYSVIAAALEYVRSDDQELLVASSAETTELADEVGVDPATIILIIQAVVQLIELWRKRRS